MLTSGPAQADQFATLRVLEAPIDVRAADEADARPATDGESLSKGDVVLTGPGGRAEIEYFDGSVTRLEPGTEFTVQELATLNNDANSKVLELEQAEGRTYNRITKLADADSRVEVETPTATASVRGTSFAIQVVVFPDGSVHVVVWCVTGVCVVTPEGGEPEVLQAGEGVIVGLDGEVERFTFDPSELPDWIAQSACDFEDVTGPCIEVKADGTVRDPSDADTDEPEGEEEPPIVVLTGGDPGDSGDLGDPGDPGDPGDTTPPTASIDDGPEGLVNSSDAAFAFTSSEEGSTFACRLDNGGWGPCSSPHQYTSLAEGGHFFRVRATDTSGNTGMPTAHPWSIDTIDPETTIDHPQGGAFNAASWNAGCGTLTVGDICGTADGTGSEVTNVEVSIQRDGDGAYWDGGDWVDTPELLAAGGTDAWLLDLDFADFEEGEYTIEASSTDAAGNVENTAVATFTIDSTAPGVTVGQANGQADPTNQSPIHFTVTFDEPVIGFTSEDVSIGGTAGANTADVTGGGPVYSVAVSGMTGDGTVTLSVPADEVTDAAGNDNAASTSEDNEVTYDTTPPDAPTITGGPPDGDSFTFEGEADATFECSLDDGDWVSCDSPREVPEYPELDAGEHTFSVRAKDAAGNVGEPSVAWTWTVVLPEFPPGALFQPANCHLDDQDSVVITLQVNFLGDDVGLEIVHWEIVDQPDRGQLVRDGTDPTYTYTKDGTFDKKDAFSWRVTASNGAVSDAFETKVHWNGTNGCGGPEPE